MPADCKEEVKTTGEKDSITSSGDAVEKAETLGREAAEALCPKECPPKRKPGTLESSVKETIVESPDPNPQHPPHRTKAWHATVTATYVCTPKAG